MVNNINEILYQNETITCQDIVLRKYRESDITALHLFMNNPDTLRYLDWSKETYTLADARSSLYDYFWASPGRWAIALATGGDTIGSIDIRLDKTKDLATFGYALSPAHWGKGYMPQALSVLIKLAFEDLQVNKIESCFYGGNEKSGRVMEKCGMVHEGTKMEHKAFKGGYVDEVMYGITKKMYLANQ